MVKKGLILRKKKVARRGWRLNKTEEVLFYNWGWIRYIDIYNTNNDLANIKCSRLLYSIYSPPLKLEVPTSPGARPVPG